MESTIKEALNSSKLVCLLITKGSLKGEWVKEELAAAWVLGKPILQVVINIPMSSLPVRLKSYPAIDFSEMASVGNFISNAIEP